MTSPSHDSQDPRAYFIIRDLASGLADVFEDLRFEPLFQRDPGTVSVVALLPGNCLAGEQDAWLTVWRGHREGGGRDEGGQRLWLRIDRLGDRRADDWIQPVDPEAPGFGLELGEMAGGSDSLLKGVAGMVKLLETAAPVHGSNSDTDLVFRALDDMLREGVARGGDSDVNPPDEDEDPVAELVQLCSESGLESVDFGPYKAPGDKPFAASTTLDVTDQLQRTVWSDHEGMNWIEVGGRVQRMDAPHLEVPAEDQDEADTIAELAAQLTVIHGAAETIFRDLDPADPDPAFELLNTVAYMAMNGAMEKPSPSAEPWFDWADLFSAHCRLGFLAGVMLEESPFGNLNIRATTLDPVTRAITDLQVYWKQDDEDDTAEHWLAVGTATGPAHDVDPEYPELLAGVPEAGREHIRHAITHLHEMVHLAGAILEARAQEAIDFVDARKEVEAVPDDVQYEMIRSTIDDAIAGLNGTARLYTGAMRS
ncbi:hypothetical protein QFZ23_001958 [Arthrobacter globiformis]|uniref:hypothetical protein n=1 Tax=Arthrobacter globiformis TaxID=1665 RepID=UPI00278AF69A|nr:hypothetical protein [Arthrobacter globiformis]MDQ1058057.1 hypothetical protein [Arthrobacter globiformis]